MRALPILVLSACLFASPAWADAPAFVPVQAFLSDAAGVPLEGEREITLKLYDGDEADLVLFEESHTVLVEGGLVVLYLGANQPLDLALFREHASVLLGVTLAPDPEMQPRLAIGSAPFAGFAQYAGDAATLAGHPAGDFRLAAAGVEWADLANVPGAVSDGDDDTLADLACTEPQLIRWIGGAWQCADLPADGDVLASLSCAEGYVAKVVSGAWACAQDEVGDPGDFGDIFGVLTAAGSGLSGGVDQGTADLGVDRSLIQARIADYCLSGSAIRQVNEDGTVICADFPLSSPGDITAVYAGSGLEGGGVFDDVTLSLDEDYVLALVGSECAPGSFLDFDSGAWTPLCTEPVNSLSAGPGLNADQPTGDVFLSLDRAQLDGWYIEEGQPDSVSGDMIGDGEVTDADLAEAYVKPTDRWGAEGTTVPTQAIPLDSYTTLQTIDLPAAGTYLVQTNHRVRQINSTHAYLKARLVWDDGLGHATEARMICEGFATGSGGFINHGGSVSWVITVAAPTTVSIEYLAHYAAIFQWYNDANGVPRPVAVRLQ